MKILNSLGQQVVLNAREKYLADSLQNKFNAEVKNALGFEVDITTLTSISKDVSEQKFYQIPFADYLPVRVGGETAWSDQILTYGSLDLGGAFEDGYINTGSQNDKLAATDTAITPFMQRVLTWAKTVNWSLPELAQASKSGNWDLVSSKEKSRKKNWDLGIQRAAFLGGKGMTTGAGAILGLLNQPQVAVNNSVLAVAISEMSPDQLQVLCAQLVEAYRVNCNRTAWPTTFTIPESDYNGLASQVSPDFPIKTKLDLLVDALKMVTRNDKFQVLPVAYADAAYSEGALTANRYALYNYDPESLVMYVPVDYTNTLANSLNNFQFQSVAFGRHSGVLPIRPLEMLYFEVAPEEEE